MKLTYLHHSAFALDTGAHFLIFDYYKATPRGAGLAGGVIDPAALTDRDVLVFASHAHGDHYSREIFQWKAALPRVRYILSSDIGAPPPDAHMLGPDETLRLDDLNVLALRSTDEGVAFLLELDNLCIYHAGDLNWWHWEGESEQYNNEMAANYKREIDKLAGRPIDLAFVPVDPRLQKQYSWGIDYLMRTAQVRHVVPMHLWDDKGIIPRLLADPVTEPYRARILSYSRRGECIELD